MVYRGGKNFRKEILKNIGENLGYGERYVRSSEENMEYASSKAETSNRTYPTESKSENASERQADQLEEEEIVVVVISNESINKAIQKLKNRKAPGRDNITNEMIKYGKNTLISEIKASFGKIS
ncbi:hypothetical protein HHI36_014505 [Cryptolaemus montrouzieri]|uniref:Uncharacterized protein n=1 Tax=Cryptolaemus montrouzieri TaxID=559131 RepID=A0ABD2N3Z5_9CUCU